MTRVWKVGLLVFIVAIAAVSVPEAQDPSVTLTGHFSGGQETPPPGVLSGAVGKITCNLTRTQAACRVDFWNVETSVVGAHIHVGPPGVAGPIVCDVTSQVPPVSNDFGFNFTCSAANFTARPQVGMNSFEDFDQTLAAGGAYFNIHSQMFPGGTTRAQLCPASAEANVITGGASVCAG